MAESKPRSKSEAPAKEGFPTLAETLWRTLFGVLDDARAELHKQTAGLIGWTEGALVGATRFAAGLNDRIDQVARHSLAATDRAGRRLVESTRDAAQTAAFRASETARSLVASVPEEKKAA